MTPEFASLVNPTFHLVLDLVNRIKGGERLDLKNERYRIREQLKYLEESALRANPVLDTREAELTQRALVYWTDEVLTAADPAWKEMTLEWECYSEQDRAWKFYYDGQSKARNCSGNVIEVWYLAMVLGFEGDIRDGFRKLKRNDFPPADASEEQARALWAKELEKQIPQRRNPGDLVKPALEGNVAPLQGAAFLLVALQWAGILFLLFCILVIMKFRGS